jgi:serine/threonine-protein kinase
VTLRAVVKDPHDEEVASIINQFQNQARASTSLRHPGIVSVYEYGEEGNVAFLVTDYVEGCALKERLRVPITDALSIIVQLLNALAYAHEKGAIHGSIRPSHLILTSKGELRITEFGNAVQPDPAGALYASPEQLQGSTVDTRSDIFSAGILLYELLTGVHPFAGPAENVAQRVCTERERIPSEVNPNVPSAFDAACVKSLAKAKGERYSSAREFGDDLQAASSSAFGSPVPELVSNQTVVSIFLSSLRGQSRRRSTTTPEAPKSQPKQPGPVARVKFDDTTLRKVEKQLAVFIGPLARVVVREAASKTSDLDELYSLAAESLEKEEHRNAFLDRKAETGSSQGKRSLPRQVPSLLSPDSATATLGAAEIVPRPKPVFNQPSAPVSKTPVSSPRPAERPPLDESPRREGQISGNMAAPSRGAPEQAPKASQQSEAIPELKPQFPAPPSTPRAAEDKKAPGVDAKTEGESSASPKIEFDMTSRLEELLGKQPESLAGYLRDNPPPLDEVIHALIASVEAVAATYASGGKIEGLVPQNICFDRLGKATVQNTQSGFTQSTSGSGVVGSPRYSAPEIFAEKSGGQDSAATAATVYALGFMFYEILLGKKLFRKTFSRQRTELEWLRWHADQKSKAPTLKSLLPDYPAALSDLLESMLEKNPEKRTADLETIVSRLRVIAQQANRTIVMRKPSAASPKPAVPAAQVKKSRRGLLVVLIVFALLLATGAFVVWQNPALIQLMISRFSHSQQAPTQSEPPSAPKTH